MCCLRKLFFIVHLKRFIILVIMYTISARCIKIRTRLTKYI
nr:MAG TPA: hypothetical protein [Bacteriophage sp.]DAH37512.1 MAG TPA: hypothetical protein [Caudoviricetes sp.]